MRRAEAPVEVEVAVETKKSYKSFPSFISSSITAQVKLEPRFRVERVG